MAVKQPVETLTCERAAGIFYIRMPRRCVLLHIKYVMAVKPSLEIPIRESCWDFLTWRLGAVK